MAAAKALTATRLLLVRTIPARIVGVFKVDGLTTATSALCTLARETIPTAKEAVDNIAAMARVVSEPVWKNGYAGAPIVIEQLSVSSGFLSYLSNLYFHGMALEGMLGRGT